MAGPWDEFSGKPWEDYGKPGSIADFPNAPGFVSTVKRTAGQMLTTGATSIEDLTGPNAATAAVRRVGQGVIDNNPAGIQSIGDIADSPWLATREALGQLVPQVAAAALGAKAGGALGGRAAGGIGRAVGQEVGALLPIASQEYGGIREDQKEAGQEDIGRALLAAGAATGLERVGMGKLLKGLRGELPPMAKIPAEIAKGALKEGATEAAQTAIEQVGAFKDPTTSESMQEQALAGVMGGIGGGVLGGVHAGAQKAFGKTKSAETADSADLEQSPAAAPPAPATPQAIRAQKLPETGPLSGAVNAGIEAQAQGLEAATGQQPLTEDEMAAAQFYVEQRRQDGTPAGQRFAAEFDAGRVSPREALEGFRLSQSPEFALPQPGVDAAEIDPAAAGALVAPGALPQAELLPVGQATEVPVDVAEPAAPIEEPRAARTPGAEGQTIDPRSPNAVAQYVDRVRAINTPAARAFVQDFEAGRITPADVMQLVAPGQENADANLQTARRALGLKDVAGTQAPDGTRLLGPDGLPLPPAAAPRTLRDAQAKRAAEKAQQQEAASAQPAPVPAAEAPAAQQQPAPAAPAGAAPAATVAQPAPVAAPKPGEKWHYRSSEAGTPMREIPAERMKDAREVPDLVPGLRFLAHRDMGDGKTWSVTERNTGLTLTTGHTTADLADFAARQRVQQVGADKVQARVRETLQKSGLSEGEALGATAEPRKGKVPGLDEVVAAYKRAAGGELDANMNATAVAFHRALADQNVKTIRDLAHPDNPKSRAVIEALSGKKLARGAMQSANIAEGWLRSLHPKPVTPQVPAPAPNAAAPVSTQAPAQAGATVAAAPATTPTDPVAKRRAVLQALRDCIAG
jgi:hypothetical protein